MKHFFSVQAHFDYSLVLTYAFPRAHLEGLLPPCLELDTLGDEWGFAAVAMVKTKRLRPKGWPSVFGRDFFLIGCRIFVRYTTSTGKRLRGLYILGSGTDSRAMERMGNILTNYKYAKIDVAEDVQEAGGWVRSQKAGIDVAFQMADEQTSLPHGSPFSGWKEARRFAGPLPFTFSYDANRKEVMIVEGVRQDWLPRPVSVTVNKMKALDSFALQGGLLANAFILQNIPYYWKKARTDLWKA